jgi:hypothetical protein
MLIEIRRAPPHETRGLAMLEILILSVLVVMILSLLILIGLI